MIKALGKPDNSSGSGGVEVLHYKEDVGWWRYDHHFVRFVDGKVESFGNDGRNPRTTANNPPLKTQR